MQVAEATSGKTLVASRPARPTIHVDVSDLLLYLLDHASLSGIQRVQCEVLQHLADAVDGEVNFVGLDAGEELVLIEASALLEIIDLFRSGAISRTEIRSRILSIVNRSHRFLPKAGDTFITLGAFWGVKGFGRLLQQLKSTGVVIGLFIHDIIPITHPEYFRARDTRAFVKAVVEALNFADFILTSSAYNKAAIDSHCTSRGYAPLPVHVIPLAHELARPSTSAPKISDEVAEVSARDFVLCVGTIEVRKNPTYLFNIWKLMTQSDRTEIPTLVFAGRRGWLVRDFIEQLEICGYFAGKIAILKNVTDVELDLLYRRCLLTMFPSFAEGWGLPVGESLSHSKICICSAAGGIPEVGRALADYVDPYNVRSGLERLLYYLDNPEVRRRREQSIAKQVKARSWRQVAEDLVAFTRSVASELPRENVTAAISLPANKFMPISSDATAIPLSGEDGSLSAELACISGWKAPQAWGAWADQLEATIRFRATCPPGCKIHLILRLAASPGANYRLHISSASGTETTVSLDGELDKLATLCCEVDSDGLVTVFLALLNAREPLEISAPFYCLKGLLYLQPQGLAATSLQSQAPRPRLAARTSEWPAEPTEQPEIKLSPAATAVESRRAATCADFLRSRDCFWTETQSAADHRPPIFADGADEQIFFSRYRNSQTPPLGALSESLTLIRRSEQYVSMSRFSEGTIFDRWGVHRGFGFIEGAPLSHTPWLLKDASGISVAGRSLAKATRHDKSCVIFYNGNLHNYYHWLAEGLLLLDILSQYLAPARKLCIPLPKSMDLNARFDHRDMLDALGFADIDIVEVADSLIRVQEAVWVESDLIEQMPGHHLKRFQKRIATKYADACGGRNKRLLIERKGPSRKIQNFLEVQEFLAKHGFETVFLEGMSIRDQISLFQSADFVIGAHGAGLTNLLFCEPGTKVLEFMPTVEMRPFFWLISEGLELRHGVQFCRIVDGDNFQATLNVDIAKLKNLYRIVDGGGRIVA
jgi:glycosyltransferase involved in cell wall biosynthesis